MKKLTKEQALACIDHGEFGADILDSDERVVVVLTQSWCMQWLAMKEFLDKVGDCAIFFLEYDLTEYFDRFRQFKETGFRNDEIPYIRYYRNGKLIRESNYVSEFEFSHLLRSDSR